MYEPKEVLEMCKKATPGPWAITQPGINDKSVYIVQDKYLKDDYRQGVCKLVHKPKIEEDAQFIALARTALPQLAERVIELEGKVDPYWMNKAQELEAENAKLRAVAEAGKISLRHCLPEPNEDEECVVCDGYPHACPQCDAGKLREALITLATAGYGGEE